MQKQKRGGFGLTPLHSAVSGTKANIEITKALISAGANVNVKNNDGDTPLSMSVRRENIEIIKLLVEAGADVNEKNNDGQTPLFYVTTHKNFELVKTFVSAGADVNAKEDKLGRTPLHAAVEGNSIDIAKILVSAGAHVKAKDKYGNTPLRVAKYNGYTEMIQCLTNTPVNPVNRRATAQPIATGTVITEMILYEGQANLANSLFQVGWLMLTSDALVFRRGATQRFDLHDHTTIIPLAQCIDITPCTLFGFLPMSIRIEMKDGSSERFAVFFQWAWIKKIREAIALL